MVLDKRDILVNYNVVQFAFSHLYIRLCPSVGMYVRNHLTWNDENLDFRDDFSYLLLFINKSEKMLKMLKIIKIFKIFKMLKMFKKMLAGQ